MANLTHREKDALIKDLQKEIVNLNMEVESLEGRDILDYLACSSKWDREEAFLSLAADEAINREIVVLDERNTSGSDVVALRQRLSSKLREFLMEVVK